MTEAEVVLEDCRVVVKAEVLARVKPPWVVEALPKVRTPVEVALRLEEVTVKALAPKVQVEGEAPVKFRAPDELMVTTPEPEPMLEVPVDVSEVKAPVDAVVAPMAVALIPVAVVLKVEAPVPEVIVKALVP